MFQFQYGAIDRPTEEITIPVYLLFQFQYGAIDRKVKNMNERNGVLFQFQYGAIDSLCACEYCGVCGVSIPVSCD